MNYQVSDQALIYASFSRGIKGPNFAAPSFFPFLAADFTHGGETLLAYEAGVKTNLFDRRLQLNIGGFLYDYQDYQAFFFENVSNLIRNRDAKAKGVEVEISARPVKGLTINAGLSFLDTKVKNVPLPSGRIVDRELPQAPGFSGNASIRYEVPLSSGVSGAVQFDMSHTGASSFTVVAAPVDQEKAYSVGNLSVSLLDANDRWEVTAFVKNLWDERYRVYSADVSAFGYIDSVYAEPRWAGVSVRYKFGK
jgi:iron complex outermembrane receptor protein